MCENVHSAFISDDSELTDVKLLKLADRITSKAEVRNLAMNGLGMKAENVQHHLANSPSDIKTAMLHIMREWRNSQHDDRIAYIKLCRALKTYQQGSSYYRGHGWSTGRL